VSKGRRHRAGHDGGGHENAERWLLTYADLITLLMVFFVVLYSMSSADSSKWQEVSLALQQAFNVGVLQGQSSTTLSNGGSSAVVEPPVESLISDNEVPQVIRINDKIAAVLAVITSQTPDVSVGIDREGIVIRLSGSYLFDSGRAELKPNSMAVLDAIATELRPLDNEIRIDGHTDSTPIDSPRYPTNWELSVARALAVTRHLSESDGVQASRLTAAGYGEFRPLVGNDTREDRAKNRRVEIHLLSTVQPGTGSATTAPTQSLTENLQP
jgi:chemotaxis protein MotB